MSFVRASSQSTLLRASVRIFAIIAAASHMRERHSTHAARPPPHGGRASARPSSFLANCVFLANCIVRGLQVARAMAAC
jgi:hypothetical protein